MGRTRKSAQVRRQEIVRAALRLAAELGPDRVTTGHLAEAVGLTQPAIFRHFPTKADIWAAVGDEIAAHMKTGQQEEQPGPPGVRLRALISRQLGFIARTPAVTAILFSRELHAENEVLRAHFAAVMAERRARFARLLGRQMEAGEIRPAMGAEDAAAVLLAMIQGLAMRWSLERQGFDLKAEGERLIFALLDGWEAAARGGAAV